MSSIRLAGLLIPVLLLLPGMAAALISETTAERAAFERAESALNRGDRQAFQSGVKALQDYPLLPYLLHADLNKRFSQLRPSEVEQFLERWGDTPPGRRLQIRWLTQLARDEDWTTYREHYREGLGTTLTCHHHTALLRTGQRQRALEGVEELWLVGRSQPDACDPIFNAWRDAGRLTPELAWGRFSLAMEAGQPGLARYLRRYMPEEDRTWANRWVSLHENPKRISDINWRADTHPRASEIITHAFNRLTRRDPREALEIWESSDSDWGLSRQDALDTQRFIALRLAVRERQDALPHLASLSHAVFDDTLRQWQARAALAGQDWETVARTITHMSADSREEDVWRYWHARALEQMGDDRSARALYAQVAESRNFYGFLAADRINAPYRIGHRPLDVESGRLQDIARNDTLRRAMELRALGRHIDARREWFHLQNQLEGDDLAAAAILARSVGWHDRAIFAAARAQRFDDIDLRFPLAHARLITEKASAQGINPAWAMAVARQESAFMEDARSHAGALGLMQIMPATGRSMAPNVGLSINHNLQLLDPEVNVSIGTYYLKRNLEGFGGHPMLSTAAYNAGAGRVRSWLPEDAVPADVWAELIPFRETRDYVRRVLAYQVIYEVRMGLTPTTLSSLLPPVTPRSRLSQSQILHQTRWSGDDNLSQPLTRICDAPGYTENPCL
ncbi:transglycosylase SLT domain-containing protein [Ectothiorhodospira variabilis]|uniref:transglycosylase SLT domain-containing protein n=1 Tax=Ectothiorhodospira variabilis TaxID=505694 RepID=UPI001EFB22F1|nr:transglycosylase SLT domain-containing protein [Ectothiorhodospira variabilis]MCG5496852.1 transglycosylase SLT domain-containing protein [Ectothiorhodospira variabilis]